MPSSDVGEAGRRRAVAALERSEERFRLLVESVVDYAIFVLDPSGVVESWNLGAERLKGYSEDEILGRHYSVFYPDEDREARLPDHLLAEAREHGHVKISGWRVRKDGSRFWADVVITALRNEDGTLAGFAKVTRDMTEAHRDRQERERALAAERDAVERLQALDRWRRDFIGAVAHDLLTPVASIAGFAEILLEEHVGGDEHRGFLERILSNARSLQVLIDHLRTYAHLESGRVELAREPIDLASFVADLVADMEPVLGGHAVETDLDEIEVSADRHGLERILRNLLTNAARHTRPGGAIRVAGRTVGGVVTVDVEDEGEGIAVEHLPRVFEPFEGARGGGTGLGLSIVKQYVKLHGGEVSAESAVGQGSTFRFSLPPGGSPRVARGR